MSHRPPTVSIAIRAYRRLWLREAIQSVLTQTYRDLELIVYDDAGDLRNLVEEFSDPRLRYYRAARPLGASGRYLAAVALCRGSYIGLLDDDDRYHPEFVEALARALRDNADAGVAFCRLAWEVDGAVIHNAENLAPGLQPNAVRQFAAGKLSVSPSRMLVRRAAVESAWQSNPMPDGVAPDLFVNVGIALGGWAHLYIPRVLVICRWHPEQVSRGSVGRDLAIETWRRLPLRDPDIRRLRDDQLSRAHLIRAAHRAALDELVGANSDLVAAGRVRGPRRRLSRAAIHIALVGGKPARSALARALRWREGRPPRSLPDSSARRELHGSARYGVGVLTAQTAGALAAPLLTRLYTVNEIGSASVLVGLMSAVAVVACLRFDAAIPLAGNRREVGSLTVLSLAAGAFVSLLLGFAWLAGGTRLGAVLGTPILPAYGWLVPAHAVVAAAGLVGAALLARSGRLSVLALARGSQGLGTAAFQIAGGLAGGGVGLLVAGPAVGSAVYAGLTLRSALRRRLSAAEGIVRAGVRDLPVTVRRWRGFGAWGTAAVGLNTSRDALLPAAVLVLYGPAAAGVLFVVQRVLATPVTLAGEALGVTWYARAAAIIRSRTALLHRPFRTATLHFALAAFGVLVVAGAVTPLFGVVFGSPYVAGQALLLSLAPAHLSLFAAMPAGLTLQALGRTREVAAIAMGRLAAMLLAVAFGGLLEWPLWSALLVYSGGMTAVSAAAWLRAVALTRGYDKQVL